MPFSRARLELTHGTRLVSPTTAGYHKGECLCVLPLLPTPFYFLLWVKATQDSYQIHLDFLTSRSLRHNLPLFYALPSLGYFFIATENARTQELKSSRITGLTFSLLTWTVPLLPWTEVWQIPNCQVQPYRLAVLKLWFRGSQRPSQEVLKVRPSSIIVLGWQWSSLLWVPRDSEVVRDKVITLKDNDIWTCIFLCLKLFSFSF